MTSNRASHHSQYPYPANCNTAAERRIWDEYVDSWLAVGKMIELADSIFRDDPADPGDA